jgi:hypothetical protein
MILYVSACFYNTYTVFTIPGGSLPDDDVAPVAVVAAIASLLLLALAVLAAICCLQRRRRRRLLGDEPEKAASAAATSGKMHAAAGLPVYRNKDDRKVAAANNKIEDLLQHNTQQLLQPVNSNLYVESLHGNEYEVPSSGGERSCYGYYDLRGTGRPSAALR